MADDRPASKKPKLSIDPVFKAFSQDTEKFAQLKYAVLDLNHAFSNEAQVIFKQIIEANAREACPFSKASVTLENRDDVGRFTPAIFFTTAIAMLDDYCSEDPRIPTDQDLQNALSRLLNYLSSGHGTLMYEESKKERLREYNWAVVVAQHLLSQLAMDNDYIIARYPNLVLNSKKCVCQKQDCLTGEFGDTSFGCAEKPGGWSGEVDVILEGSSVSVQVQAEEEDEDTEASVSSIEVKTDNVDHAQSEKQTIAQAIVFSFLQRKCNKALMNNCLVPSITVGTTSYRLTFYDSENDVLVSTLSGTKLFNDYSKDILYTVTVLLWMTLNHRLLCSGVPQDCKIFKINDIKAGFFERVGDHLQVYQEKVSRHVPLAKSGDEKPKYAGKGKSLEQVMEGKRHIDSMSLSAFM